MLWHSNKQVFCIHWHVSVYTLVLYSLRRRRLTGIGIPIINLRWSDNRIRFKMGIPILIRRCLLIEKRPINLAMEILQTKGLAVDYITSHIFIHTHSFFPQCMDIFFLKNTHHWFSLAHLGGQDIWVSSWSCSCLITWFCTFFEY